MTLQEFIASHRDFIDGVIRGYVVHPVLEEEHKIDDEERELWIMNDESLYNLAVEHCGLEEVLGVQDQ